MTPRVLVFAVAGILLASTAAAQTDFSGTWILKDHQSISGILYSNGVPKQITVVQSPKTVILERITAGADGKDFTTKDTLPLNGKAFKSLTASKRNKETTWVWNADKSACTIQYKAFNTQDPKKVDFRNTDTWKIENDQLVQVRKNENFTNGETWETKAIYDKQ